MGLLLGLAGIWFGYRFSLPISLFFGVISFGLLAIWKNGWTALLLVFFGCLGYSAYQTKRTPLPLFSKSEKTISGIVMNFPDSRRTSVRVQIETDETPARKLIVVLPANIKIDMGNAISATGITRAPSNFGGFDYREYLGRLGIIGIMNAKTYKITPKPPENTLYGIAVSTRNYMKKALTTALPEPHATLVLGVLAGVRDPLPRFTEEAFQDSGLTHLLVVSGVNVVYLVLAVYFLMGWAPPWWRFWASVGAVTVYALVTGAEAPVVRASIMGLIAGVAASSGNQYDSRIALLSTLLGIGLYSPKMLLFDPGLHLSALATAGIIFTHKWWYNLLLWVPKTFALRTIISLTLSAQMAVTPLLILQFDTWPIGGIFANIITEPIVPIIMLGGTIITILTPIFSLFWLKLFAIPTYLATEVLSGIATVFALIPSITLPEIIAKSWLLLVLLWEAYATVRLAPGREMRDNTKR